MDITTAILITVAILFCTNLIGYIYTALILHTNLINDYRIQPKEYFAKRFYERFPLILFNISILLSVGIVGVFLLQDFIDFGLPTVWVFTWQLILIFLIDDLYFYFYPNYIYI